MMPAAGVFHGPCLLKAPSFHLMSAAVVFLGLHQLLCAWKGDACCLPRLPIKILFPNFWCLDTKKKFNRERRLCGTKFGIVDFKIICDRLWHLEPCGGATLTSRNVRWKWRHKICAQRLSDFGALTDQFQSITRRVWCNIFNGVFHFLHLHSFRICSHYRSMKIDAMNQSNESISNLYAIYSN